MFFEIIVIVGQNVKLFHADFRKGVGVGKCSNRFGHSPD